MALVTKTFAFATDSETLADLALLTTITFAFEGADGNPSGSVKFTSGTKSLASAVEKGRGVGTTWETFGVPAGATVNTVRVVSYERKIVAVAKLSSHSHILRFVNGSGATIGGDLASEALPTATGAWLAGTGIAAAQTVAQASNATALFEIQYTLSTLGGGGAANIDTRVDQVLVEIDYTAAGVTHQGAATPTGVGSVAAPGAVTYAGAAALAGTGSTASTATLQLGGAAALAGAGSITTTALLTLGAAASITGTAAVAADLTKAVIEGAAALVASGTIGAAGGITHPAAAVITSTGTIGAAAGITFSVTSAITATASLVAAAGTTLAGAIVLTASGAISAVGTHIQSAVASLAGSGLFDPSGTLRAAGAAVLAGTATILAAVEAAALTVREGPPVGITADTSYIPGFSNQGRMAFERSGDPFEWGP